MKSIRDSIVAPSAGGHIGAPRCTALNVSSVVITAGTPGRAARNCGGLFPVSRSGRPPHSIRRGGFARVRFLLLLSSPVGPASRHDRCSYQLVFLAAGGGEREHELQSAFVCRQHLNGRSRRTAREGAAQCARDHRETDCDRDWREAQGNPDVQRSTEFGTFSSL